MQFTGSDNGLSWCHGPDLYGRRQDGVGNEVGVKKWPGVAVWNILPCIFHLIQTLAQ